MSATTHQAFTASIQSGSSSPNPFETHQEACKSAARRVPDSEREGFLPELFGRMFLYGEGAVYVWMRRLCSSYTGGHWGFYRAGDQGAGFMAPDMLGAVTLSVDSNGYEGQMSAEAAGIVVTLFALNHLMLQTRDEGAVDLLVERYHALREFAVVHPEQREIFRAID